MSTSLTGSRGSAGGNIGNRAAGGNLFGQQGMKDSVPQGYKLGQIQQFSPEQMQLFQQLFSHVGPQSYLSRLAGGEEGIFGEAEAPAWRNFQQGLGELGSRFSGLGLGARNSSGFQLASTQATSDFAQQLASNRQSMQRQALQELLGISGSLLGQRPTEKFLAPKQKSFLEELLSGLAGGIGQATGIYGTSNLLGSGF